MQLLRLTVLVSIDSGCRFFTRGANHLASQKNWITAQGLTKFIHCARDFVLMSVLAGIQFTHCNDTSRALVLQPRVWFSWCCTNLCSPKLRYNGEPKMPTQSLFGHWFYWNLVGQSFSGKQSALFPLLFVLTVGVKAFPSTHTVTVYSQRDGDSISPHRERSQERHCAFISERMHFPCCPLGRLGVHSRDLWVV